MTRSTEELYYYGNDQLGTPVILTDSTNTVVWEATYRPFGEAEINPNSTVVSNFRFPGQYYDQETGLHYNYHRYYDPETGRYLRADPVGLEGGINPFVYAGNNPINWTDPLGLKTYATLTMSVGGGLTVLSGEGGVSYAVDVTSGEVHSYDYVAYGLGLGFGGGATVQVGAVDMDDPEDLVGWGLEVSAFAAAIHGISGQLTGTGLVGTGEGGGAVGYAAGAGAGIAGMGTYTWYKGEYNLKDLPADIIEKLLQYFPDLRKLLEDTCE